MNKGERFIAIFICFMVLSVGLSMASLNYKSDNIATQYSGGQRISGTINISFSDEWADSLFTGKLDGTYFDESISLIDLLKANSLDEEDYYCIPSGCEPFYEAIDENDPLSSTTLREDDPLIAGFIVYGEDLSVSSLKFSVQSSASSSCQRQLLIDVLNKNESFIQSNKHTEDYCDEDRGCFSFSAMPSAPAIIGPNYYCEKINLDPAPAYRIGARVRNNTGIGRLFISLQHPDWEVFEFDKNHCTLPPQPDQTPKDISCDVNYTTSGGDYLVCINSDTESGYEIDTESTDPICGSIGGVTTSFDFNIFAQPLKFAPIGVLNVDSDTFSEQNPGQNLLVNYVDNYLEETYQRNCSNGCFIPFKFTGYESSQTLTFSDVELIYHSGLIILPERELYELKIGKSKLTTPKTVNLEMSHAEFEIPVTSSARKLYLYLNGDTILSKSVSISPGFSFGLTPQTVFFGVKTNFQAITSANISYSNWDFGDGKTKFSFGKGASHRYTTYYEGGYDVEVELTRTDGKKAINTFDISFGSFSESADKLASEYDDRIENLGNQIELFSPFVSNKMMDMFNLTNARSLLNTTKIRFSNASTDSEYSDMINSILSIDVPESLETSEKGNDIPLEFGFENMDVGYIEEVSGESVGSKEELKSAIVAWFSQNYDVDVNYDVISRTDNDEKNPILTHFKMNINKKPSADKSADEAHLIIDYPKESIVFASNYSQKKILSGASIPITGDTSIDFLIPGKIDVSTISMYISPKIDSLGSYGSVEIIEKEGFNWGKFILWVIILLVFALGIYVVLQQWYKKKYESYLFKNSADLYNVINFIHNSRKAGLKDGEIGEKLRKVKWKGEQISYTFRKLDGKRTGMPELPFMGYFEKRKIMKEIEKRRESTQAGQSK